MNYGSSEEEACKAEAGEEVDGQEDDGEKVDRSSQDRQEEEITFQRRGARPRAFFIPLKNQIVTPLSGTRSGVDARVFGAPLSPPKYSHPQIQFRSRVSHRATMLRCRRDPVCVASMFPNRMSAMRARDCMLHRIRPNRFRRPIEGTRPKPPRPQVIRFWLEIG